MINDNNETKLYTQLRSQVGFQLGKYLYFYNGVLLDQSLLDDSLYVGEKWRGFAAYTEQAYLRYTITPEADAPLVHLRFRNKEES